MNDDEKSWPIGMTKCYFCLEGSEVLVAESNTVASRRQMREVDGKVANMRPCSKCEAWMKEGIILITIDPSKSLDENGFIQMEGGMPNPWRTGGFFVVKEQAFREMMVGADEDMLAFSFEHRFMFIEHEAAVKLGLFKIMEENKEDG